MRKYLLNLHLRDALPGKSLGHSFVSNHQAALIATVHICFDFRFSLIHPIALNNHILTVDSKPVEVAVKQIGSVDAPRLQVTARGVRLSSHIMADVTTALERLLGIRINLSQFYSLAVHDTKLDSLAKKFRGLKPPRFPTDLKHWLTA